MRKLTSIVFLGLGAAVALAGCNKAGAPADGGDTPAPTAEAPAAPAATVSFASQVKPILEANCFKCHGGEERIRGGLNLTTEATALKGSEHGVVIVAGDASASKLIAAVSGSDPNVDRMPPKGEPLGAADISLLSTWIDEGASYSN